MRSQEVNRSLLRLSNFFIWTGLTASIILVGHIIIHADRYLHTPASASIYLGISVAAALAFAIPLFLSPGTRVNMSLTYASLIASLYAVELFLTLGATDFGHEARMEAAKKAGIYFDTRTKFEFVRDLRAKGVDMVSLLTAGLLFDRNNLDKVRSELQVKGVETIPLGGIANAKVVLCNESGEYVTFDSDRYGFSNNDEIWNLKAMDVAVLGDSFSQGTCAPDGKDLASIITKTIPATVNLSMAGNGPLLELAGISEYLSTYRPKVTLWFYFEGNDLINLKSERNSFLVNYLDDQFSQDLMDRSAKINDAMRDNFNMRMEKAIERNNKTNRSLEPGFVTQITSNIHEIIKLSALRQRLGLAVGKSEKRDVFSEEMRLFKKILATANRRVKSWGGKFYFVYLPEWGRYRFPEFVKDSPFRQLPQHYKNEIKEIATSLSIPFIDIDAVFQSAGDPLAFFPYRQMGHYNIDGHKVVADAIVKELKNNIEVP